MLIFPDISISRTVTEASSSEFPIIYKGQIEQYVIFRQAHGQVDTEKGSLEKGQRMTNGRTIEALDFKKTSIPSNSTIFFRGIVTAEMKKNNKYYIKLFIYTNGEIQNSSCDWPAGIGLHSTCKNVVFFLVKKLCSFVWKGYFNDISIWESKSTGSHLRSLVPFQSLMCITRSNRAL
ncbi:unnamed protein product [Lepeophtheirus salmonis]|nr:unnamed protein product [Lepeophtheirus salmonis]CAF2954925.1 unnamed protein product [Lepeophtheirus salmonis]